MEEGGREGGGGGVRKVSGKTKQLFFENYQILEKSELSSSRDGRDADGEK